MYPVLCFPWAYGRYSNICQTRTGDSTLGTSYSLAMENTTSLRPKKNQKNPSTLHCIPFTSINMTHISQHKLPYSERIIGLHPRSQESMGFEIHSCKKGVCCRIHRNSNTKDRPHSTSQELCVLSQLFLFRGFLCIISTSLCLLGLSGFCFLVQILKIENLIGCWSAKSN